MSIYDIKPTKFLTEIGSVKGATRSHVYCAGFEFGEWRCNGLADHLIEWLPEYALPEDELALNHGNAYTKLKEAAVRVYTSDNYKNRGEVGEIALHAVCREFFGTIPISPRVFYKSASNDVVKSFDLVHARVKPDGAPEIWMGESKLYEDSAAGISEAIRSVRSHLTQGFLQNQKLVLGPQIPRTLPNSEALRRMFKSQTSLDELLNSAVFVIGILGDSAALRAAKSFNDPYPEAVIQELTSLSDKLADSDLVAKVRTLLVYVPLSTKKKLLTAFDRRLKGLQ
jgi:hypothetical protein